MAKNELKLHLGCGTLMSLNIEAFK